MSQEELSQLFKVAQERDLADLRKQNELLKQLLDQFERNYNASRLPPTF